MELFVIGFIIVIAINAIFFRNKPYIHKNVTEDKFVKFFWTLSAGNKHMYMLINPKDTEILLQYMIFRENEKWWVEFYFGKESWATECYEELQRALIEEKVDFTEEISKDDGKTNYLKINLEDDIENMVWLTIYVLRLLGMDEKQKYKIRYGNF